MLEILEAIEEMLMKGPIEIEQSLSHMNIRLIRNNLTIKYIVW
jgi:hypothetical protein